MSDAIVKRERYSRIKDYSLSKISNKTNALHICPVSCPNLEFKRVWSDHYADERPSYKGKSQSCQTETQKKNLTLEFERNDTVFNRDNVDVPTVGDKERPNIFEDKVDVLRSQIESLS